MDTLNVTTVLNTYATSQLQIALSTGSVVLQIMKGAVPTPGTARAMTSAYITSSRSADKLLTVNLSTPTVNGSTIMYGQQSYVAATASGTATWFVIWTPNNNFVAITGDVSDPGGAGFLKINDVNIVAGGVYKVMPMAITIPQNFQM